MAFEFVSNCSNCNGNKFHAHFRIAIKDREKGLLSAANVLTNSLKITNQTNKDFFQFNISQIHGKLR